MVLRKYLLPISWSIALIIVFLLSGVFSDQSPHFFGIAGEREQVISFQYPVEIVQVLVSDGNDVQQGQQMLVLRRHELSTDLSVLKQEIKRYQLQKQEAENALNSQLLSLKARKQANIADMDQQIHTLELRLKINSALLADISGQHAGQGTELEHTEIKDLKRKRYFLEQEIQAEIDHLSRQLQATSRPIDAQLDELIYRKQELLRQNVGLNVSALFNGCVASINYKAGELVAPFQPIMSVQSRTPRFIKAYIHEQIVNDVKVGQAVWVQSIALNNKPSLEGTVASMGNRIVEYPERLKVNPAVAAWGREVLVRLNKPVHVLLFGEKVKVMLDKPQAGFLEINMFKGAHASENMSAELLEAKAIQSANKKIKADKIEASGLLWLPAEELYLLISDEHYKKKQLDIYFYNDGLILNNVSVADKSKLLIDDLESISSDGDFIYILSSLSHNSNDKLKAKRKKIIRFKLQNQQIGKWQEVDLYQVLNALKDRATEPGLSLFLQQAIASHSMDIESHFVVNNALYLGFKAPFLDNARTAIIKIDGVNEMFDGTQPVAEIWQAIPLIDPENGTPMQLSDMIWVDEQLFLLGVSNASGQQKSILWCYRDHDNSLKPRQIFTGLKAEGLAYRPDKSVFTVVFDQGSKTASKYISLPLSAVDCQ